MIGNINIMVILISVLFFSSCGPVSEAKKKSVQQAPDSSATVAKFEISSVGIDTSLYVSAVEKYLDSLGENFSNLSLSKADVFGGSAEGGEIGVYCSRSDTLILKALYYGESGKNEYNLYFRGRQLVAFRETAYYYNSPIGKKPVEIDRMLSASFLLHDGNVVIGRKGGVLVDRGNYEQKSSDIKDIYGEITKQLKNSSP